MNKKQIITLTTLAGLLASLNPLFANGFRNPPEGAANLAIGGKAATVDDASATTHNPANLVLNEGKSYVAGVTMAKNEVEFTNTLGQTTESDSDVAFLPYAFVSTPINENLSFGIGLTVPFGQGAEWPRNGALKFVAPYFAEMFTLNANPVLSYKVNDRLSVGVGVNALYSELEIKQELPNPGGAALPPLDAKLDGDGDDIGFNAGITFKVDDRQTLAATFRSGHKVEYEGDTRVTVAGMPALAPSSFKSEIEFGAKATVGYAIDVSEDLTLALDVDWIESSVYENLPLDFGANNGVFPFPPAIPQNWDDTWSYELGARYQLNDAWNISGGLSYLESPVPSATIAPTLVTNDKVIYRLGTGFAKGAHSLDVTYAFSESDRSVSNNLNPAYNGEYDLVQHIVSLSYALDF